jgi:hypothetical protein
MFVHLWATKKTSRNDGVLRVTDISTAVKLEKPATLSNRVVHDWHWDTATATSILE